MGNLFQGKNGYGTYVTTVSFSDLLIGEQYALHIPYTSTAYTLYFNGVKQTSLGKVATNADDYMPKQQVKTHYFTITDNEMVIALQVANYSNMIGGATRDITIVPRNVVNQQYQAYTNKEYFILGSFLFMVLNVFSLYYFRRKDRSYLWVGLLGSFLIIWYVFSKDHLIMDLFPEMSWAVMTKIELLVIFLAFTCYNYCISVVYAPYYNEKIPHYSFISFVVIAAEQIEHVKSEAYGVVTVSVDVAEATAHHDAKQLIAEADAVLYGAKHSGRNAVLTTKELRINEDYMS